MWCFIFILGSPIGPYWLLLALSRHVAQSNFLKPGHKIQIVSMHNFKIALPTFWWATGSCGPVYCIASQVVLMHFAFFLILLVKLDHHKGSG